MVKDNIERSKAVIYFLLTAVFLLTFGPFNSAFITFHLQWHIITFTASTLLLIFLFYYKGIFLNREPNLWIILCMVYAGFILAIYLFHRMAIHSIPDTFNVNVAGVKAVSWQQENTKFTIFYLFFPALFLLQYTLLKKLDTNVFIRFFALAITISLAILFYQSYVDITFFNNLYWALGRQTVGGLSTDPNAYAMTAFLLLPLFIFGVFFESRKTIKAFYLTLIISLLIGMIFSGSRTGLGGVFLLAVSLPMILAIAYKQWPRHLRLILFISPLIFMILTYLILPFIMNQVHSMDTGVLTQRLVTTWDKFEEGGLARVFFPPKEATYIYTYEESRGRHFLIAWALLLKAPLAGWGPGGFYREFPNMLYIQSGEIRHAHDSALNHYLMIGGDLGLPVLIFNLILIISPLIIAVFILRKLSDIKQRFIIAILLVANIIFLIMINTIPPSYFPDLIWVWTAQLAYIVIVGEKNGISFKIISKNWRNIFYFLATIAFLLVVLGSYRTTFGQNGYKARQQADWWPFKYEKNCYAIEKWKEGVARWCNKDAALQIPITKALPAKIKLTFIAHHPDIQLKPVTVKYGGKAGVVHEVVLKEHSWKTIEIPVTMDYIYEIVAPNKSLKRYFVLSLDVSRTWIPKEWDVNDDTRELGLAVLIPNL